LGEVEQNIVICHWRGEVLPMPKQINLAVANEAYTHTDKLFADAKADI
jgi:hypothetical protein